MKTLTFALTAATLLLVTACGPRVHMSPHTGRAYHAVMRAQALASAGGQISASELGAAEAKLIFNTKYQASFTGEGGAGGMALGGGGGGGMWLQPLAPLGGGGENAGKQITFSGE